MDAGGGADTEDEYIPFDREISEIITFTEGHENSRIKNIAVIAEPYSGEQILINGLLDKLGDGAGHHKYGSIQYECPCPAEICPDKKTVILEGCHYLFSRKIGGFDSLNRFLTEISGDERIYITFWNIFAWDYLSAAENTDSYFQKPVIIEPLKPDMLMDLMKDKSGKSPDYIDDRPVSERNRFTFKKRSIKLPGFEKAIKIPYPGYESSAKETMSEAEAERYAFERIADISGGNYGIAKKLWKKSITDDLFRLSQISSHDSDPDLKYNEAYTLLFILMWGALSAKEIMEMSVSEGESAKILFKLSSVGLISNEGGRYSVEPLKFVQSVEYLKKIRMVW
ncbi:hypothetical protein [Methanoplanus endosymbiosus]|uniref:Uncharacterized protein n=1 Tax=Methanoplanus endosymbiosus TaxID=33865 RepID=A0A9E7PLG8_9EURY|nr:hypothetical protein [Methanoplanus endosymbiosus]UUX91532.1 hypothetical protein L6E24_09130 [Methanoplanus endosymbiosus]